MVVARSHGPWHFGFFATGPAIKKEGHRVHLLALAVALAIMIKGLARFPSIGALSKSERRTLRGLRRTSFTRTPWGRLRHGLFFITPNFQVLQPRSFPS